MTGATPHGWPVWARALAGFAVLAAVVWWYPVEAFTDAMGAVDAGGVLAALGIGAVTTTLSAARWRTVARGVGLRLPLRHAVADYYLAVFLNAVLPAGVLGDVHRALSHGRYSGDMGRGVRAVVLERMAGQAVLAATGAALLFVLPAALLGPGLRALGATAGVLAAVVLVLAVGLRVGRARRPRWWRALRAAKDDARAGLFARGPRVVVLSVAALAGYVSLFLVASRLAGVTAPVLQLVPLLVLALLAMSLPVNVGGWGPREAVTALAFGAAGLGSREGLTVSVVYGLLALVAALPGAVVLLVRLVQRRQVPREGLGEGGEQGSPLGGRGR
ncbi:lysylphosphatidylglycerol synthase transmembrane domain-containing protein [Nocardiopsis quinghaiensis]|uniref:lysylphosphatidylglycerol synthase transmembrane domain-containing protein n=1 Tax=Nocardiopsis quinghaiensis TaxID=464995 RepID=UPI001CC26BD1|nr:lysylphosphatidylglycerol synthase transmembrane domain-containing protein [Nocardiopsis quinghaiensis]